MSNAKDILESAVENVLVEVFKSMELPVYNLKINGDLLEYNFHNTGVGLDADGDLNIDVSTESNYLLDLISNEDIISYLENEGYEVNEVE